MIIARIKSLVKRGINWWRRRQDTASRLARLEHEVYALRTRIEVSSAFYERRLDAVLRAIMERESETGTDGSHSKSGSGITPSNT